MQSVKWEQQREKVQSVGDLEAQKGPVWLGCSLAGEETGQGEFREVEGARPESLCRPAKELGCILNLVVSSWEIVFGFVCGFLLLFWY